MLTVLVSMGSKSLNQRKKMGVKFYDPFLIAEWLKETLATYDLSIILPLDFSEILKILRNYSIFYISAHLRV